MLGERLLELRKSKGYSQAQVAMKLGISQGAVSQWEHGITVPAAEQLISLGNLYGISVDELLGREKVETSVQQPRTLEARIVSFGMDRLPKEEREKILSILQTMYNNDPDIFKKEHDE